MTPPMAERTVAEVMTRDVVTLHRNDKLIHANDVMSLGRIRHLPIVDDDGRVVGLVSQRDLFHNALLKALGYGAHAATRLHDRCLVQEAMTSPVLTCHADTPLAEAAQTMLDAKVGCLVVTDGDERLAGILTESDFVRLAT